MRQPILLAGLVLAIALAAITVPPPAAGDGTAPTPGYLVYLPVLVKPPATAEPTNAPAATRTPTATPTRTPSAACMGDEVMSFDPSPGATGSPVAVAVTSVRASVYVTMQATYGGTGVTLTGPAVDTGGNGYTWTWTFTPYQPGVYTADFYVDNTEFCAGGGVKVLGTAVATPTPTPTMPPAPPPEWDPRLTYLQVGISGAPVSPGQQYWRVSKGVFQDHIEGGGGHAIAVEILDEGGNRLTLPFGAEVGFAANGGTVALAWTKLDEPYPVVYDIYGGLGSYSVWLTEGGLPSERVYGMGLVASDGTDAPLLAQPGKVHVNYLFTFRRTGP